MFSSSRQFQAHSLAGPLWMKRGISKTAHREGEQCVTRRSSLATSLNIFMDIIPAPVLGTTDEGRKQRLLNSSFRGDPAPSEGSADSCLQCVLWHPLPHPATLPLVSFLHLPGRFANLTCSCPVLIPVFRGPSLCVPDQLGSSRQCFYFSTHLQ